MPTGASIGFQSNGVLFTPKKGEQLIAAGLSTLCLSLDSLGPDTTAAEHSATAVKGALAVLNAAKRRLAASHFRAGLEIVLSAGNIATLPRYVQWAADHGAEYVLASHLLLYDREAVGNNLFNPNPAEAIELVERYQKRAATAGGDLANALATHLKFHKNKEEQAAAQLFTELLAAAKDADIRLHLPSLLAQSPEMAERVAQAFAEAESVAAANGIELKLPRRHACSPRACPFIAERAVCIAASGAVTPCHFLWHSYSCRVHGEEVQVRQLPFGWLQRQPLEEIWQSRGFRQFRHEAGEEGYASCWSCSQGPCPNLVKDNIFAAHDCYGSQVPCGHCQWNLGGVQCL
jgi:putative metalloenzyme radical SAM/SPASM domain maturase